MPARTAAGTDPLVRVCPSMLTEPVLGRRAPKTVSTISLRPAPTSPASPRISPGRTSKETSANSPGRPMPSTTRSGASDGGGTRRCGKAAEIVRPVIREISSDVGVVRAGRSVATVRPSLSTVSRSPMRRISSSRCEM